MLEEAIEVIRALWQGGQCSHYGKYFTVENARLYTLPDQLPPIIVSAFGDASTALAARVGDGLVSTKPDGSLLRAYDDAAGRGPKLAQVKVVWDDSVRSAEDLAYRLWPTSGLEGELSQLLPTPAHFEQAVAPLHRSDVIDAFPCGPDPEKHIDAINRYRDAGYDEVYVTQVGPNQEGFLRFYEREILPAFRKQRASSNAS
jgi:G6PDH family F420-dependent oxidoreductase